MAFTFSAIAIHVWPFSYTILVAEITFATNFFMMIPYALCLEVNLIRYANVVLLSKLCCSKPLWRKDNRAE